MLLVLLCGMILPFGAYAQSSSLTPPDLKSKLGDIPSAPEVKKDPAPAKATSVLLWSNEDRKDVFDSCLKTRARISHVLRADRVRFCNCYQAIMEREYPRGIPAMTVERLAEATERWVAACKK